MVPFIYASVPPECVHYVSEKYRVPSALVYAIIKTEGGSPGRGHRNLDGSVDWGPMQINGRWFVARRSPVRKHFPYFSPRQVKTDPCVNTEVGVWILSRLRTHVSLWTAVGHYHSFNPRLAHDYTRKVKHWYFKILKTWRHSTSSLYASAWRRNDLRNGLSASRYRSRKIRISQTVRQSRVIHAWHKHHKPVRTREERNLRRPERSIRNVLADEEY